MLILPGGNALSDFRISKLLTSVQTIVPDINNIAARFIHYVSIQDNASLVESELAQLKILLNYGTPFTAALNNTVAFIVTPRPGTISPWSSKATDIVHNSGLAMVTRVERGITYLLATANGDKPDNEQLTALQPLLYDRMTEVITDNADAAAGLFVHADPQTLQTIDIRQGGIKALQQANNIMGLALSAAEIDYLYKNLTEVGRNPTDVELMMFAQINSEHCRHKIFNAEFTIDNHKQPHSLFELIRQTHATNPGKVLSAYHDNAAIMQGYRGARFIAHVDRCYRYTDEDIHILMKVETHNHPTAISPRPGAATGSGGEIRDEAAAGRGAKPKAGLSGFAVSNLKIPGFRQPWETDNGKPDRVVSALDIMLEGPIGAASYNNEFGRPVLCGYFRSYEQRESDNVIRGYHKPIMLTGGYGMVRAPHIDKKNIPAGARLIVLGGPAMLIGLGGGAAASMASGTGDASLDFASVQRGNAEMQRRCQEVIDSCWGMGDQNPILSIHDVGAGGLSNAIPELVMASSRGARLELRNIPNAEPGMSPMGIWCNESQERYVLAIAPNQITIFEQLCQRERAPFAILGEATATQRLILNDSHFDDRAIDMPLSVLLGNLPRMRRDVKSESVDLQGFDTSGIMLEDAVQRVLRLPSVASKQFLITIGDRTISGLVVRDQMVGQFQVPVADCAVTSSSYYDFTGEAMAIGERTPIALSNAPASGRMAIAEALLNICAARILKPDDIVFSANWMAACGEPCQDAKLYATVAAVSQLCKELGIAIPVGKDSLSMNTVWQDGEQQKKVSAPLSLNISAFARVADVRQSLTPQLQQQDNSCLLFIDLARGQQRMGLSALCQVYEKTGRQTPDVDSAAILGGFFTALQILNESGMLLAYHDRSDGGLLVTLAEMAFSGHIGLDVYCNSDSLIDYLFNEELGAVIQISRKDEVAVRKTLIQAGLEDNHIHIIASLNTDLRINIHQKNTIVYTSSVIQLQQVWAETSYRMQALRDNPDCARQEFDLIADITHSGLFLEASFQLSPTPAIHTNARPNIAILREQGVNGQVEMAAAFDRAGFNATDVHMQDLIDGGSDLKGFHGLAACGGFSYGDVLGAGGGWAKTILHNPRLTEIFLSFFTRRDTFALGVCNGCQTMSRLRGLIPGAGHWPDFICNESEQFEARLVMVEIIASPSILFAGMAGSRLPVAVAHGEGRVLSATNAPPVLRYVDSNGHATEYYPLNPNGSAGGLTAVTNDDGRFTIMMPHPERVFLSKQFSWLPPSWNNEYSPWMQLFLNARRWLG